MNLQIKESRLKARIKILETMKESAEYRRQQRAFIDPRLGYYQ